MKAILKGSRSDGRHRSTAGKLDCSRISRLFPFLASYRSVESNGSVATLQERSDMLGQCSLRHRFPVCSSGGNSNRKSSFWRLVGICVFPCRTGTSRSCLPSEVCTPITSRCGVGSSGTPQKWNDVCALGSDRPTTVGEWTKPTSGSKASGSIYTGLSTPAVRRSTSFCRLNATQQRPGAFSPRLWAERTILKAEEALKENCRHRPVQYLNNVLEQDHRAIKRRIRASQHFRSFWGARRTIAGYEAIHMIRKGQAYGSAPAARGGLLHCFILGLFSAVTV